MPPLQEAKDGGDSEGKPEHMLKHGKKQQQPKKGRKAQAKKPAHERQGDWVCGKCHNLNFAFRNSCNLCGA